MCHDLSGNSGVGGKKKYIWQFWVTNLCVVEAGGKKRRGGGGMVEPSECPQHPSHPSLSSKTLQRRTRRRRRRSARGDEDIKHGFLTRGGRKTKLKLVHSFFFLPLPLGQCRKKSQNRGEKSEFNSVFLSLSLFLHPSQKIFL